MINKMPPFILLKFYVNVNLFSEINCFWFFSKSGVSWDWSSEEKSYHIHMILFWKGASLLLTQLSMWSMSSGFTVVTLLVIQIMMIFFKRNVALFSAVDSRFWTLFFARFTISFGLYLSNYDKKYGNAVHSAADSTVCLRNYIAKITWWWWWWQWWWWRW